MKKRTQGANRLDTMCPCGKDTSIYVTIPDFGDPPIINKCHACDTLYWHIPEEEAYIKPPHEQAEGKLCAKCGVDLKSNLEPTHKNIKCKGCDKRFSLGDDFLKTHGVRYDNMPPLEKIEVYLLYSEQ